MKHFNYSSNIFLIKYLINFQPNEIRAYTPANANPILVVYCDNSLELFDIVSGQWLQDCDFDGTLVRIVVLRKCRVIRVGVNQHKSQLLHVA